MLLSCKWYGLSNTLRLPNPIVVDSIAPYSENINGGPGLETRHTTPLQTEDSACDPMTQLIVVMMVMMLVDDDLVVLCTD